MRSTNGPCANNTDNAVLGPGRGFEDPHHDRTARIVAGPASRFEASAPNSAVCRAADLLQRTSRPSSSKPASRLCADLTAGRCSPASDFAFDQSCRLHAQIAWDGEQYGKRQEGQRQDIPRCRAHHVLRSMPSNPVSMHEDAGSADSLIELALCWSGIMRCAAADDGVHQTTDQVTAAALSTYGSGIRAAPKPSSIAAPKQSPIVTKTVPRRPHREEKCPSIKSAHAYRDEFRRAGAV